MKLDGQLNFELRKELYWSFIDNFELFRQLDSRLSNGLEVQIQIQIEKEIQNEFR